MTPNRLQRPETESASKIGIGFCDVGATEAFRTQLRDFSKTRSARWRNTGPLIAVGRRKAERPLDAT